MLIEKAHAGFAPLIRILLEAEESILAVSSTFVGMSGSIDVQTRVRKSLFLNQYRAVGRQAELLLGPKLIGEIHHEKLIDKPFLIRPSAFMAVTDSISMDSIWRGSRSGSGDEGVRMIRCSGKGDLIFNASGEFHYQTLEAEQNYVLDARHLVGLDDQMAIRLRRIGGVRSAGLAAEAQAIEIQGPGRIVMQTRARSET
jgi:uncharacterized protein (AIM24 family)